MSGRAIRVLLVEDNPGDANLVRSVLRRADRAGYLLEHAEDLAAALCHLESTGFDVILLDLSLPDSFGLDTLKQVHTHASETPILVLTGNEDEALGVQSVQAGAEDYLVKGGIDGALLTRAMRYAIERHRIVVQLQKFDRLKSEFLSTASHEMRTPLTIIREFVSLVHDGVVGPITPEQAECLSDALRNCDRLTALLNDLLDMSKLKSTNIELRRRKVDPKELLAVCYRDFAPKCRAKNIELRLETPDILPAVLCDADRISQAIVNLVGNAYKFTPEGGQIVLRAYDRQTSVAVEIRDTGKGISRQDQELIFDAFTQVDRQDGPGARGTGLGLAITKRIVELHNGVISVESEPGQGSCFTFTLPAYDAEDHMIAFIEDLYRGAGGDGKTLSLALLRAAGPSADTDAEMADLLSRLEEHAQHSLRPGDKCLRSEIEPLLAFVMESDAAGSLVALRRLMEGFTEATGAGVTWEAGIIVVTPDRSIAEWIQTARQGFTLLE
jgi:signal transduction histidine kinase